MLLVPVACLDSKTVGYCFGGGKLVSPGAAPSASNSSACDTKFGTLPDFVGRFIFDLAQREMLIISHDLSPSLTTIFHIYSPLGNDRRSRNYFAVPKREYCFQDLPTCVLDMMSNEEERLPHDTILQFPSAAMTQEGRSAHDANPRGPQPAPQPMQAGDRTWYQGIDKLGFDVMDDDAPDHVVEEMLSGLGTPTPPAAPSESPAVPATHPNLGHVGPADVLDDLIEGIGASENDGATGSINVVEFGSDDAGAELSEVGQRHSGLLEGIAAPAARDSHQVMGTSQMPVAQHHLSLAGNNIGVALPPTDGTTADRLPLDMRGGQQSEDMPEDMLQLVKEVVARNEENAARQLPPHVMDLIKGYARSLGAVNAVSPANPVLEATHEQAIESSGLGSGTGSSSGGTSGAEGLESNTGLVGIGNQVEVESQMPWILQEDGRTADGLVAQMGQNVTETETSSGAFDLGTLTLALGVVERTMKGMFVGLCGRKSFVHQSTGQVMGVEFTGLTSCMDGIDEGSLGNLQLMAMHSYYASVLPVPNEGRLLAPKALWLRRESAGGWDEEKRREEKRMLRKEKNRLSAARSNEKRREKLLLQRMELKALRERSVELRKREKAIATENELFRSLLATRSSARVSQ